MQSAQTVVVAGGFVNLLLIGVKYYAATYSESAALLAEANHSILDLLADIVTFFAVRESSKGPSATFPYGRAKFESVCAVVIGCVLVMGGFGMASEIWHDVQWDGLLSDSAPLLFWPSSTTAPTSSANTGTASAPATPSSLEGRGGSNSGTVALAAALLSLACKEVLYRVTSHLGRALNSVALVSNAAHYRSDAFASLVAVAGIAGSFLGFPLLDPAAGLFVSGMLLHTGVEIGLTGLRPLVDAVSPTTVGVLENTLRRHGFPVGDDSNDGKSAAADDDNDDNGNNNSIPLPATTIAVKQSSVAAEAAALKRVVKRVDQLRARSLGSGEVVVDLRVHVEGNATAAEACAASEAVRMCLLQPSLGQLLDQGEERGGSLSCAADLLEVAVLEVSVQLVVWQGGAAKEPQANDNRKQQREAGGVDSAQPQTGSINSAGMRLRKPVSAS